MADTIGHMTEADLRRFIVNLLASDPGVLPKKSNVVDASVSNTANISPSKLALQPLFSNAGATVTFTSAATTDTGCSITIPATGTYVALAAFDFNAPANTGSDTFIGFLTVNGVNQAVQAIWKDDNTASGPRSICAQHWLFTANYGDVVKTRVTRNGAAGTAQAVATHTNLVIFRVG